MPFIPIFRSYTLDQLRAQYQLEFELAEWVSIELPYQMVKQLDTELATYHADDDDDSDMIEYECNRYDGVYTDDKTGNHIRVYVYMNESSSQLIAIDEIVEYPHAPVPLNLTRIQDSALRPMVQTLSNHD